MARIVCQVLHRADRITFLWSDGSTQFEPYTLEGAECTDLLKLSARIHTSLTGNASELTQLGEALYRALFRSDAIERGSAAAVEAWVKNQDQADAIERIEFVSDQPGLIPWNVVSSPGASDGDAWKRCWGCRFSMGVGRRVNALRQNSSIVLGSQLFIADLDLVEELPPSEKQLVTPFRDSNRLVHTVTSVEEELRKGGPDLLLVFANFENGRLRLGSETFTLADLQTWLDDSDEGNPDPFVVLMATGPAEAQGEWQAFLSNASATFNGLIANETLVPAGNAFKVGHTIAQRLSEGTLGNALRVVRQELGEMALAFSAFCPPHVRAGATDSVPTSTEGGSVALPLPESPYRPFAAYDAGDRALFFGRDVDTARAANLLDRSGVRGLFVHGAPGGGKTSFLQAGLLPYLEQDCVGYRVLRDRSPIDVLAAEGDYPILILRATEDLVGQFADALSVFCAQPLKYTTPAGNDVTVDLPGTLHQTITGVPRPSVTSTAIQSSEMPAGDNASADEATSGLTARDVWIALRDDRELLGRVLDAITRALPFELVIAVDQGEELITLVRRPQQRVRRQKALMMLESLSRTAPRCKIVYTIRSQSFGQLASLFSMGHEPTDWRAFFLRPLTEAEMANALLWPTNRAAIPYSAEMPHEKYGFSYEDGLAEKIVKDTLETAHRDRISPLSILQAAGELLYERRSGDAVLRQNDLKTIEGDALSKCLDARLKRLGLSSSAQQAFRDLIAKLTISHADGTVARDLVPASNLKSLWTGREPIEPIVNRAADQEGLFEIQQLLIGGQDEVFVSLSQDSLAQLSTRTGATGDTQKIVRQKVIDVLWIMIPLMFLAAAVTFWGTRYYNSSQIEELSDQFKGHLKKVAEEFNKQEEKVLQVEKKIIEQRPAIYYGQLAQADRALQADNALRARQILLSQPAIRAYHDDPAKGPKAPELRGFEWRYLWKQLNSERHLLAGHTSIVTSVAVSHQAQRAATGSIDGTVRIWNLANGEVLALINVKNAVHAVALSPDGKTLASAGADGIVRLYDLGTLKTDYVEIKNETKTFKGHEGAVNALAFGKDAKTLASGGADLHVILWDLGGGKEKRMKEHGAAIQALAFSSDGKTLASAGGESEFILWDADAGKVRQSIKTPYKSIAALTLSSDGKSLATGGIDRKLDGDLGTIRFWDAATGKETRTAVYHSTGVLSLAFGADANTLASGGKDHVIRVWDVASGTQKQRMIGHIGAVGALAFAGDGSTLISGSYDQSAKVWDPARTSGADVIAAHTDGVLALAVHPKGTLLASGSRDGSLKLWDARTGKLAKELPKQTGAVTSLAFSNHKDKTYLAVGTRTDADAGEIKILLVEGDAKAGWKTSDHQTLKEHKKGITCLAFHPSAEKANVLVSGSADQTVKAWDIEKGKETKTHRGHKDEVRSIAFAPDGKSFASGGKDALACIYELDSDDIGKLTDLHLNSIEAIAFYPSIQIRGDRLEITPGLITGSADHTMSRWAFARRSGGQIGHKEREQHYRFHAGPVSAIALSTGQGGMLASAGWDGAVKLYDGTSERFTLLGHTGPVRALAVAPDQSFIASAGNDGTIRLWRAGAPPVLEKEKKEQKETKEPK